MTPINKLLALMKLSDSEFEERLHQMAVDFKNDGVIRA